MDADPLVLLLVVATLMNVLNLIQTLNSRP